MEETLSANSNTQKAQRELTFSCPSPQLLIIHLGGTWELEEGIPDIDPILDALKEHPDITELQFSTEKMIAWDSALLTLLVKTRECCKLKNITINFKGLPEGIQCLLELSESDHEKHEAEGLLLNYPFIMRIGKETLGFFQSCSNILYFIGELVFSFGNLFKGKANFRARDLMVAIQECGAEALPIVTIISLLLGVILAFVGAVELQLFGAEIYTADLVGLGMTREMGAMMSAIIMSGRTGAAYAAELGTMQVNEEIDAFVTTGIAPMEFLVLPRVIALAIMMPLLTLYADMLGMFGGSVICSGLFDISFAHYWAQSQNAVDFVDISVGVFKGCVFGILIGIAGCQRGMKCLRSSAAVGLATTSAVVTSIVMVVIADSLFTFLLHILGI